MCRYPKLHILNYYRLCVRLYLNLIQYRMQIGLVCNIILYN